MVLYQVQVRLQADCSLKKRLLAHVCQTSCFAFLLVSMVQWEGNGNGNGSDGGAVLVLWAWCEESEAWLFQSAMASPECGDGGAEVKFEM